MAPSASPSFGIEKQQEAARSASLHLQLFDMQRGKFHRTKATGMFRSSAGGEVYCGLVAAVALRLLFHGACAHSTGAGHCIAPFSYTHGKNAQPGSGGFRVRITPSSASMHLDEDESPFQPGGTLLVTVDSKKIASAMPFKGLLLYTSHGSWGGEALDNKDLQFKESCDDMRGPHRTLTHVNNDPKQSVTVELLLPTAHDADADERVLGDLGGHIVINAVVMQELRKWYWLNTTLDGRPPIHSDTRHSSLL